MMVRLQDSRPSQPWATLWDLPDKSILAGGWMEEVVALCRAALN